MNWTEFAVCLKCGCSAHGRCPLIRSHDTASAGLTLATGTTAYSVAYMICVCWCNETGPRYLSDVILSAGVVLFRDTGSDARRQLRRQRRPPISWYHQLVAHQLETVRLPLQVRKGRTVYCQPSAQPPNRSLPSKKNLNRFFLDFRFVCNNVYCI